METLAAQHPHEPGSTDVLPGGDRNGDRPVQSQARISGSLSSCRLCIDPRSNSAHDETMRHPLPGLGLPAALVALLPAVEDVVAGSTRGVLSSRRLAAELLRFLRIKVSLHDTGRVYLLAPPPLLDAAWQALLLETAVSADVCTALDVAVIHRSARQPYGDAGHAARLRATFGAAATVEELQDGDGGTTAAAPAVPGRVPTPDTLLWGVPDRADLHVRITLLPVAAAHARPVLHALMPPLASVSDLAQHLCTLYGTALERFRPTGPLAAPLHATKLLRRVGLGGECDSGCGDGSAGGTDLRPLQLFAPPAAAEACSTLYSGGSGCRVTLTVNGHTVGSTDGSEPLCSVLTRPELIGGGGLVSTDAVYFSHFDLPDSPPRLDETRPLSNFHGARLLTSCALPPTADVPVTLRFGADTYGVSAILPEAWTLADFLDWMRRCGSTTLYVDGEPAPTALCHASCFTALDVLDAESYNTDVSGKDPAYQIFLKNFRGKTRILMVKASWTVLRVKYLVQEQEDVRPDQQRLIFAGFQLHEVDVDSRRGDPKRPHTLADYKVVKESTIHLVLRLLGC